MELTLRHLANRLIEDRSLLEKHSEDESKKALLEKRIEQHKADIINCVLKEAQAGNSYMDKISAL